MATGDKDTEDSKVLELSKDEGFKKLQQNVEALAKIARMNLSDNKKLREELDSLKGHIEEVSTRPIKKSKDDDDDDDLDFEDMSKGQLAKYIFKEVEKAFSRHAGSLREELDTRETEKTKQELEKELKVFTEKHPDFYEFAEEVKDLVTKNPTLSIQQLYNLAKIENPEKAKEVEEKMKKEQGSDTEIEKAKPKFGGLTPTSRAKSADKSKEKLSQEEASEKAWEETLGDIDANVLGDEDELHSLVGR